VAKDKKYWENIWENGLEIQDGVLSQISLQKPIERKFFFRKICFRSGVGSFIKIDMQHFPNYEN
jgi:hypothetical protein